MPKAVPGVVVVVTDLPRLLALVLTVTAFLFSSAVTAAILPEDRTDILYHRYEGDNVKVDGPSVLVRKSFADKVSLKANYYVDHVSSASIDVLATASPYTEERKEFTLGGDYLINKTIISASYTHSEESDYTARTTALSVSQDFFGDLSNITIAYGVGRDEVRNNTDPDFKEDIDRRSFSISYNQILTRNWTANFMAQTIVDEGFLNNPYRSVRYLDPSNAVGYSYQPEVYPGTRNSDAFALRTKYFLPWRAAFMGEYRYFNDSWGIKAHNFEVRYTQPFNFGLTFELRYRNYRQNNADFYSDLFPFRDAQNFLARDKELATFTSNTFGVGLKYQFPIGGIKWLDKGSVNLFWDHMQFDYDDFRNVLEDGAPGEEPLFSFSANVIRAYFSIWY